jgi:hypothetical protein
VNNADNRRSIVSIDTLYPSELCSTRAARRLLSPRTEERCAATIARSDTQNVISKSTHATFAALEWIVNAYAICFATV